MSQSYDHELSKSFFRDRFEIPNWNLKIPFPPDRIYGRPHTGSTLTGPQSSRPSSMISATAPLS